MASSSASPSPSPRKKYPTINNESDLAQSLKQLSLATSSPSPARSPRPFRPAVNRSPSSPQPGSALRSPLNGPSSASSSGPHPHPQPQPHSRSATPTLLRKASLNSLQSSNGGIVPPRRASSVLMPTMPRSPLRATSTSPPEMSEQRTPTPTHTAASIAADFFKEELSLRHGSSSSSEKARVESETVVILQDDCYGHRYSRPRTSRAALSTIVERPERVKAAVLGVSAAYVRLGERHSDGAHGLHPKLTPASIPTVPFRIHKTSRRLPLTSQTVTNVHGTKWMEELKIMCDSAESRLAMNGKELQRPDMHRGPEQETPQKFHEGDLYLCADSLGALEGALGAVCEAVDAVFDEKSGPKRAFVAIRPPGHHCSASYPSGFCWINNVHVGIMHAILSHGLTHAAIIDFDLHHGDGSQSVAWQHNTRSVGLSKNAALWKKTSIGYFSLHDINSYPCEMGDEEKVKNASLCIENAHGQNIWNVHLQPWRSDAEFWQLYDSKYSVLLAKTRAFLQGQTERLRSSGLKSKAAIFLSAGFDASEWESAGMQRHNVNVPTDFYARFSRDVVRIAAEEGTSVEGRIISVLEGGYSDRALYSGVLSHLSGLAGDDPVVRDQEYNGLGYEMGQRIGTAVRGRKDSSASERGTHPYEPSWWSVSELEKIEALVAPPVPLPDPKKPRNSSPPTYSSPTQSSSARAVAVLKVRRSMSGLSALHKASSSRAPTPPPPEVPWTVAAHELSKLLIPSDRQTGSCTHEDLAAEATRARQARQSVLAQSASVPGTPVTLSEARPAPSRMALRERKAKPSLSADEDEERKNRRKTVAGPVLATAKGTGTSRSTRAPSRRLSAASTVVAPEPTDSKATALLSASTGTLRSETSQSIRPESSMSVRTASTNPLTVRKTRTANPVKREVTSTSRQPRIPKKSIPPNADLQPSSSNSSSASSSTRPTAARTASGKGTKARAGDDVDKLAGEMKKIKITVLTQAQREAREQERLEREKQAKAQNEAEIEVIQAPTIAISPPWSISSGDGAPNSIVTTAVDLGMGTPQQAVMPSTSPIDSSPAPHPQCSASDVFIQYQPEGPTPPAIAQQQPLQWLPPNASTPVAMRQTDLPVFTSTSAIPFASFPGGHVQPPVPTVKRESPVDDSVWEIPNTPHH